MSYPRIVVSAAFAAAILVYVDLPKIHAGALESVNGQLVLAAFNLYALGFLIAFVTDDPLQGLAAGFFATVIVIALILDVGMGEIVHQILASGPAGPAFFCIPLSPARGYPR